MSKAVENAYLINKSDNAWFVQADLQFLPFSEKSFDVIYSSGVIHHTNNTELSLSLIEPVLKQEGKLCLWLYHPQKNFGHKIIQFLRSIISRLPLKLGFALIVVFVFPFTFLIKKIKNKNAPNYREEIIDLLDAMTPEHRFEIPHDLATVWLQRRNFKNIKITTSNMFGFSISAEKE
jgi:ubiquinone/menaquinone biosynthesis C-methylase UbiE